MRSGKLLAVMATILLSSVVAYGQNNPNTDQGLKPYDSLHGGALDSVSMTSGNLFFHRLLYSSSQRGRVELSFSLQYNNKGFRLMTNCPTPQTCSYTWILNNAGVGLQSDQSLVAGPNRVDSGATDGGGNEIWVNIYSVITSDGSVHQLGDTGNGYRTIDGSGIFFNSATNTVLDRGGMYNDGLLDPNGNLVSVNSSAGTYTDTLGRIIPWLQAAPAASLSSCPNLHL